MKTLRLLLWLRWKLAWNASSVRSRWVTVAFTTLFALAFSPVYIGGAIGSYLLVRQHGPSGLLIVFGACHIAWVWMTLLTGALGRLFDLDKILRHPVRPFTVYATNLLASCFEPLCLMTWPSLAASAFALAQRDGMPAGLLAAAGALALVIVTASLLQLLLAVLDDLLRREWMRYVAAFGFTATIFSVQVLVRGASTRIAHQIAGREASPEALLRAVGSVFARVPTISAPLAIAGVPSSWFPNAAAGFAGSLALSAIAIAVGVRVSARAVLRAPAAAGRRRVRPGAIERGSFAPVFPLLSRGASLLLAREFVYLWRTPALLYQLAVVPLMILLLVGLRFVSASPGGTPSYLPFIMLTSAFAGRNLMMFGFDGPGVKTLVLLPFRSRDVIVAKNLYYLVTLAFEGAMAFSVMFLFSTGSAPLLGTFALGYLALGLVAAAVGTWMSIEHPVQPPQRGMARRSPGGALGLGALLGVVLAGGTIAGTVALARWLAPPSLDVLAGSLAAAVCLAVAAVLWWISLDRNAEKFEAGREKLIEVLARTTAD